MEKSIPRETDNFPDDVKPRDPKAEKPEDFSDLPAHISAVLKDFVALRKEKIPPDGASLLVLAAQVRLAADQILEGLGDISDDTQRLSKLGRIAIDVWKDPTLAVSFVRYFEKTRENLAKADDELLRGEADLVFEQSLQAMRRQLKESD